MANDYALKTTKLADHALGRTMAPLVAQECHCWLTLADMRDIDKACFLDRPISQMALFGDTIGDFTQEFSGVKEETNAMGHLLAGLSRFQDFSPTRPTRTPWSSLRESS